MIYGYARVSTDGQSVDAQVKQLRDAGAEKVFREPASGARSDRAQLRRALDQLGKGDVLMVTRLDRLARSTRDLLNTVAAIAAKKAGFQYAMSVIEITGTCSNCRSDRRAPKRRRNRPAA